MIRLMVLVAILLATVSLVCAGEPQPPKRELVVIACRVDDLTGQPGRHDPAMAARDWRDLELHLEGGELQCRREIVPVADAVSGAYPEVSDLNHNLADHAQCASAAMTLAQDYNAHHRGWGVVAIGCPSPLYDKEGNILSYRSPDCPSHLPGTDFPLRCNFDPSLI